MADGGILHSAPGSQFAKDANGEEEKAVGRCVQNDKDLKAERGFR
jgi:hypothetical protein